MSDVAFLDFRLKQDKLRSLRHNLRGISLVDNEDNAKSRSWRPRGPSFFLI